MGGWRADLVARYPPLPVGTTNKRDRTHCAARLKLPDRSSDDDSRGNLPAGAVGGRLTSDIEERRKILDELRRLQAGYKFTPKPVDKRSPGD